MDGAGAVFGRGLSHRRKRCGPVQEVPLSAPIAPMSVNDSATSGTAAPVAQRSAKPGLPWFIAGGTFLLIALLQLIRLPEWLATKTQDAVVGNLTGVLALFGVAAGLTAIGYVKRR